MKKQSKVSALVLSLVLFAASGLAHAEFTGGMGEEQVKAEILAQQQAGKSAKEIAKAAKDAGVSAAVVVTAFIKAGVPVLDAVRDVAAVNPTDLSRITTAAKAAAPAVNVISIRTAAFQGAQKGLGATASQGQQVKNQDKGQDRNQQQIYTLPTEPKGPYGT